MRNKKVRCLLQFMRLCEDHSELTIPQVFINVVYGEAMHKCATWIHEMPDDVFEKLMNEFEVRRPY